MSGHGAPSLTVDANGRHIDIVATTWHSEVMDGLVAGARAAAEQAGATHRVLRVAGSFELISVCEQLARSGSTAIAALGVVIRGDTPHFDYVCEAVTRGLTDTSREHAMAIGFGVLTCDDEQQAIARAGLPGSRESKGAEAVEAALQTAELLDSLR